MREKPRILGQLPFHLTHVCCKELHEEKCTLKTGGGYTCFPHTIMKVCGLKEH